MQEKPKAINKEAPQSPIVLPKVVSCLVIIILSVLWFEYTTFSEKIRSLIISASFSLIESTFYGTTIELPNGDIIFKPFDPKCRKPHTTFAQFFANLLYVPIAFYIYYQYVGSWALRILFYPLHIWSIEIIEGYAIMIVCGKNIAWHYYSSDALFHGNIRLKYWIYWLLLGVVSEILYFNYLLKVFP